jgi:TolA-binding protein
MDTMKILLGATIALLLGALAMSWSGMQQNVRNAPADEIARLKKQVDELKIEQDRLQLEKQIAQMKANDPVTTPATQAVAELDSIRTNIESINETLRAKADAERLAKLEEEEQKLLDQREIEGGDDQLRRARLIANALLIGKVVEYIDDGGGFATIQLLMPEVVQPGSIIAIRRKTGILGQLKISDITPEGAIANPIPGFGNTKPEPGDELILPPQF